MLSVAQSVAEWEVGPLPTACPGERWMVLHTKSRQEKTAAQVVEAVGARCWLPLRRKVMRYGHRKRVSLVPVFSCYVFMLGRIDQAYAATSAKRAARVIPVVDEAAFLADLDHLQHALARGADFAESSFLQVGHRVRVRRGPFEGLEGVIELGGRGDRINVQVRAIGRALSLQIDADLLEPTEDR